MYDLKFIHKAEDDGCGNHAIQEVDKNGGLLGVEWQPLRTGIRFFSQQMNASIHIARSSDVDETFGTEKKCGEKVLKSKLDMVHPLHETPSIYTPEILIFGYDFSIKEYHLSIFPLVDKSSDEYCTLRHQYWYEEALSIEVGLRQETIDTLWEGLLSRQDSWIELDIFRARRLYQSSKDSDKYKVWPHDKCVLDFVDFPEGWPKYGPWKNEVFSWSLQVSSRFHRGAD